MTAYNQVLGLQWFKSGKPEIDCDTDLSTLLITRSGQDEARRLPMRMQWYECRDDESTNVWLPDSGGSTPTINCTSEIPVDADRNPRQSCEDIPTPDSETLRATTFDDPLDSNETIETFPLPFGECSGLLGATMKVITLENPGESETINPKGWTSKKGALAVVAAEQQSSIVE
jgi:hypothetical protein